MKASGMSALLSSTIRHCLLMLDSRTRGSMDGEEVSTVVSSQELPVRPELTFVRWVKIIIISYEL